MNKEQFEVNVRGALYDFAGYLTTMDDEYTVGAQHDAARMANEVENFLTRRGSTKSSDANVTTWQEDLPQKELRQSFDNILSSATKGLETNEYNQLLDKLLEQC